MAKQRNIFLGVLILIPAVIHFFLLNKFVVNFPSWGDDIIYLDLIEKFDKFVYCDCCPKSITQITFNEMARKSWKVPSPTAKSKLVNV